LLATLILAFFTSVPGHAAIECSVPAGNSTNCRCHGDTECNEMFSKGYCKEGNDHCDSGTGICTCAAAKAGSTITGTPPKHVNPVAAPIVNGTTGSKLGNEAPIIKGAPAQALPAPTKKHPN
jgi:hypothetical protein